jgi:hypothetical protein
MIKHLQMHPHPGNCAIMNITHFGYSTTNTNSTDHHPLSEIEADLIECETRFKKGMLLASLNDEQVPYIEPILKKLGWQLVIKDVPGQMLKGYGMGGAGIGSGESAHTNNLYVKILTRIAETAVGALDFHREVPSGGTDKGKTNTVSRTPAVKRPTNTTTARRPTTSSTAYSTTTSDFNPWWR